MSELTREKIYKRELLKKGATGNNNLERIRSLQNGGGGGATTKLESTRVFKRKKYIVGGWTRINFNGTSAKGDGIWTDGDNIYYSYVSMPYRNESYVLNKQTSTWEVKEWEGITENYTGKDIWTDGENIYLGQNFVLNKEESRWYVKEFGNTIQQFDGYNIWSDGYNIYYSDSINKQYVLDKETYTWIEKSWNGDFYPIGKFIWTDGDNIYYSQGATQFFLDLGSGSWVEKTWNIDNVVASYIWTDGENIYYSSGSTQYVLELQKAVYVKP